jgi:hypothetical protein
LRKLSKNQRRTVPTHTLVAELPSRAREWIATAAAAEKSRQSEEGGDRPVPELAESSQELAYAITECAELEADHPWIVALPDFIERLLSQ